MPAAAPQSTTATQRKEARNEAINALLISLVSSSWRSS